ncbi:MAG: acyl-CoA carboxylase subunit beta [Minisyncoccus archaeiphilus]|uniref:acyl-CoA carboxylase subunit beta n=1 Tax=Minisyncoccus archaeiphilus TaxID=3238481 RepID=UPI0009CBC0E4|nr:MAG: Methylmalonyl-CoA carboxyltransferase 12S subunit [Parcubacteria group bacterium ADurb.Bin216]GMX59596.1 MAG: acyl-CoA carboxylase subunit beta [Candidatus Parcubacteria bacterium]
MKFEKQLNRLGEKIKELNDSSLDEKQHAKGKLTARERINLLVDPDTFIELDPFMESRFDMDKQKFPGDSVVTGFAKIDGRIVYLYSQDFSKMGGSLGEMHGKKVVKVIELAEKNGCPIIGIIDSGGARIQEGVASLDGYATIFRAMVKASGIVPQISVMVGPSAGGASYAPGLSDFVFMVEGISQMYITGPDVIKSVTGEDVTFENLGGSSVHASKSGCAHFVFQDEKDCFIGVKRFLSYLPQNNMDGISEEEEVMPDEVETVLDVMPEDSNKAYDMKQVIKRVFDKNSFFEIQSDFAMSAIVGFARMEGRVIGVVANQPRYMAGVLDIDSSDKIARFVRFCDAFNIPLVNLVDTPGYLPGTNQEYQGIIRHGAKILYAYSEASVPKISVIIRKAFGGAYIALTSRGMGYDKVIAWPTAQIAVMGVEQAVKIIYKKEIQASKDPQSTEKVRIEEMRDSFLDPFEAAKLGQVDMIIDPKDTRKIVAQCLEALSTKRELSLPKKHGSMPL